MNIWKKGCVPFLLYFWWFDPHNTVQSRWRVLILNQPFWYRCSCFLFSFVHVLSPTCAPACATFSLLRLWVRSCWNLSNAIKYVLCFFFFFHTLQPGQAWRVQDLLMELPREIPGDWSHLPRHLKNNKYIWGSRETGRVMESQKEKVNLGFCSFIYFF